MDEWPCPGGPEGVAPGTNEPPPAGPEGARHQVVSRRSAADLEHLAAALGARPLERRLAVLHRDLLRILDLDLLLVLHAVGLCHLAPPHADRVTRARLSGPRDRWVWRSTRRPERRAPARRSGLFLLA